VERQALLERFAEEDRLEQVRSSDACGTATIVTHLPYDCLRRCERILMKCGSPCLCPDGRAATAAQGRGAPEGG